MPPAHARPNKTERFMGMTTLRWIPIAALAVLLAACGSTPRRPAPVVEQGGAVTAGPATQAVGNGYYMVKKGDTLYRIALQFGQSPNDLVTWNHLANANDIKVDQVLRVVPPEGAPAVQVGSVAAGSGVEVRPLTPGAAPAAAAPAAAAGEGARKQGPLGDKKPYSEAALAEMQKPDAAPAPAPATAAVATAPAPAKPETPPAADDDGIGWIWPTEGKVIRGFDDGKKGIDIAGKLGQPIVAAGAGRVMFVSSIRGYGNLVIIKHTANLLSAYAHNKTILVKEGQTISKGQKIAEMGNSDADSVRLHFEIRRQGNPVDPAKYLPRR